MTRDNAERARNALALRGISVEDPTDRVTADEWLELERSAREADDAHRDVQEHDLADIPQLEHTSEVDPRAADTASADIRDISIPDASEHNDPAERRRVPLLDETALIVDRAQDALVEIAQRTQAEQASALSAIELEPDDDARRRSWPGGPPTTTAAIRAGNVMTHS